ncbi:MAG TPA: lysophospholipid acyltransferase family protein [Anaerolineae bacterium]|nr:lysophospholipid acyltransferase family protein [Anaerolineae bacterium]
MLNQFLYWVSRPVIGLYAQALLRWQVFRQSPLPEGPKLIVANHPTTSDPFFVALAARQPANILITEKAFQVPLFGAYLRRLGHIPVIPGQGRPAFERARQALEAGRTVIMFPEGTLSHEDGRLRSPRTGAARLALLTGAPIIPIGIHLLQEKVKLITSIIEGETVLIRWPFRGPYTMTIGSALHFNGDVENWDTVRTVGQQVMAHIERLVEQARERMTPIAATGTL